MRHHVTISILPMVAAAVFALPAAAQQPSYRNPDVAEWLEVFVPLLGYHYAGDWRRGTWPALTSAAGAAIIVVTVSTPAFRAAAEGTRECVDFWGEASRLDCANDEGWQYLLAGGLLFAGGRAWGMIGAGDLARGRTNARLSVRPGSRGGISVGLRASL
jgi:hypothetical protein